MRLYTGNLLFSCLELVLLYHDFWTSLKEAKRKFLTPGGSLGDSWHIVSSSTTLIRLYTENQLSYMSRKSPSLPCHLRKLRGHSWLLGEVGMILDTLLHLLQCSWGCSPEIRFLNTLKKFNKISVSRESSRGTNWILGWWTSLVSILTKIYRPLKVSKTSLIPKFEEDWTKIVDFRAK